MPQPHLVLLPTGSHGGVVETLLRNARLVVICFLALAVGAVLAVVFAAPVWHGQMKILVKRDRADSLVSGAAGASDDRGQLSEAELLSQAELIRANDVLQKVAENAGLAKELLDSGKARSDAEALALAVTAMKRDLSVTPIKKTWLIDVTYKSRDPQVTRNVLDTLLRLYLEKHLALQRPAGTFRFFSDQADLARRDLDSAQQQMAQFTQTQRVVVASQEKQNALQKLSEFDAMRAQAVTSLAESERRLTALNAELSRVPAERISQVRTSDDAQVLRDVKARILELESKRTGLLQKFTPEYRAVVEIDTQLRQARAALDEARRSPLREETVADNPTRQWLETELARTQTDREGLRARAQALSGAVSQYRSSAEVLEVRDVEQQDLARTLKAAEAKYLLYVQKREEARISDELDRTRIANVVVAESPSVEYTPERTPGFAALPLLLGGSLILSFAFALVFDAFAQPLQKTWALHRLDRAIARNRALMETLERLGPSLSRQSRDLRPPRLTPLEGQP